MLKGVTEIIIIVEGWSGLQPFGGDSSLEKWVLVVQKSAPRSRGWNWEEVFGLVTLSCAVISQGKQWIPLLVNTWWGARQGTKWSRWPLLSRFAESLVRNLTAFSSYSRFLKYFFLFHVEASLTPEEYRNQLKSRSNSSALSSCVPRSPLASAGCPFL